MKTTLLLIRHGQTTWNVMGRIQGHEDVPLNDTGQGQAEALAQRLKGWPITAVYSSDLQRAAMTATVLGRSLGLDPSLDTDWRECHMGLFQGLTLKQAQNRFPQAFAGQKRFVPPVKGETYPILQSRVIRAYDKIINAHRGEMVAVVSHGRTLSALIGHILDISVEHDIPFSLRGNTGISIVENIQGHGRLISLNDTAHLEA